MTTRATQLIEEIADLTARMRRLDELMDELRKGTDSDERLAEIEREFAAMVAKG